MATVRKRNGRFQVQIRLKGSPSLTRTFDTKSDAIKWSRDIESRADTDARGMAKEVQEQITFGQILEKYYIEIALSRKWHRRERSIMRNYRKNAMYNKSITDIDESAVAQYRDARLRSVKPATIVRELAAASHCITIAQREWGMRIPINAFKLVRKPKVRNVRERRISDQELDALMKADAMRGHRSFSHIIEFAIETAMRKGELLRTRWIDIDFDQATLHIPMTKNDYPRTIPLTPKAIKILWAIKSKSSSENVFNVNYSTLSAWWTELLVAAGVKNCRWHDLRHEGISRFFEYGLNVPEVALISGHRDFQMLRRYTHIKPQNVAAKLARLSGQSS